MGKSSIEWTDFTWNPLVGCSRISHGCEHCYAETMAARVANAAQSFLREGRTLTDTHEAYRSVVRWQNGGLSPADIHDVAEARWNGRTALIPSALAKPLTWSTRRRVFVNSMSDLFHASVTDRQIATMFGVMTAAKQHAFQVLTKRAQRSAEWSTWFWQEERDLCGWTVEALERGGYRKTGKGTPFDVDLDPLQYQSGPQGPFPNVWMGTSVENQKTADERIDWLVGTRWAVKWLSIEPLLGPINLAPWIGKLDWIVVGGESGHGARPMNPEWVCDLRDQAAAAGVPFLFKQWGAWAPWSEGDPKPTKGMFWTYNGDAVMPGEDFTGISNGLNGANVFRQSMTLVGKGKAGRVLDGVTHDGYPHAFAA